jgi:hypothetical protein
MRYLTLLLLSATLAMAYITPPDKVLIDGRITLTNSRPLATFPWPGEHPRLSEYPNEGTSDSREIEALWEIKDNHLYLLAVSAFRLEEFAPRTSGGLRDLMPDRIRDGKVLAEWFTGDFDVIEMQRVDRRLFLRPQDAPPMLVKKRKFIVSQGRVKEVPNDNILAR